MDCIYSDFDSNLAKQRDGDVTKQIDFLAVRNSLVNILTTMKGSRRMLPGFGSALQQYLFEPLDEIIAEQIGSALIKEVRFWDNRVVISNVNVNVNHDANQYEISISYGIVNNSNYSDTISFVLRAV